MKQAHLEVLRKEVRLIFVANTEDQAHAFAANLLDQMKNGALNITLTGWPTCVTED